MIKTFVKEQLNQLMSIWINTNIEAHDFIPETYWFKNFEKVQAALPEADILVWEEAGAVLGFIGIAKGHIAGLFVLKEYQGNGIGRALLDEARKPYKYLSLNAYAKNEKAVQFYLKNGFKIEDKHLQDGTGEEEYTMVWEREDDE